MPDKVAKAYAINDAKIGFVSLVGKAANKRKFLITKSEGGNADFMTYGRILKADSNLKSLQELADDGIFTVSDDRLKHSAIGNYVKPSKMYQSGRMKSGGHSQAAMDMCAEKGIEYSVTKTLSNGVRLGNVPSSAMEMKRSGDGQAWFPESWDEEKIRLAGTAIANNDNPLTEGYSKTGVYDGVAVRVLIANGNIGTVCPDLNQSDFVKGVK